MTVRTGDPGWRRSAIAALLLVAGLAAASCDRPASRRPLVIAFGESAVALDPHRQDRSTAWSVLTSVYDGLVELSPTMEVTPALAVSWRQIDATHWRFDLRDGVRFQDGRPLTAADVVASFERGIERPFSAVRHYLAGVRGVRTDGAHGIVVETAEPVPDLLSRLAFVLVVPARDAALEYITAPVGTGSYRFKEALDQRTVVLEGWKGWRGRPAVEEVRFIFPRTREAAAEACLAGTADVCHLLPDDLIGEVARRPGYHVVQQPTLAVDMLSIHLKNAQGASAVALRDARVRRAILLALDREGWSRRIFRGNAVVASQLVHPAVFGFDPAIQVLPRDVGEAKRLLAEAGWAKGFEVTFSFRPAQAELATALAADLAEVGIQVRAVATPSTPPAQVGSALDVLRWACATGDASDFFDHLVRSRDEERGVGSGSDPALADPTIDALLEEADHESDPTTRRALLQRAQRRVVVALPLLPLLVRWGYNGVSDRVEMVARYDGQLRPAAFRPRQ